MSTPTHNPHFGFMNLFLFLLSKPVKRIKALVLHFQTSIGVGISSRSDSIVISHTTSIVFFGLHHYIYHRIRVGFPTWIYRQHLEFFLVFVSIERNDILEA